uniref:Uncharacterized protein n=1 Tax=Parascaris equorum TaxID=6256 RepID=A0A914RJ93_PAREQ
MDLSSNIDVHALYVSIDRRQLDSERGSRAFPISSKLDSLVTFLCVSRKLTNRDDHWDAYRRVHTSTAYRFERMPT